MDSPYASSPNQSSDSEPDNAPQAHDYRIRRRAQERLRGPGASENRSSPEPGDQEDVPLEDDNSDQGEHEEGYDILDGALVRGAMHRDRSMNELVPDEDSDDEPSSEELQFDDAGVVGYFSAAMFNEAEEVNSQSTSQIIQNPSGADVPQGVLSATAQIAQNNLARSYDNLAGGLTYTAQRAQDAMATTAQAGGHLAEGAWRAGNGVAIWAQERWPNVPRVINRRVLDSLAEIVMEGVQALPPSDSIIRPQGRR
ncbi:hypothetical protein FPHYL_11379 [Fusarium phyllophilum]|uniref:Uncharacterized protein n=1 Tax=Fusarium phyllophilum TaxID=47803 RepID=A0A8H5IT95_9HYPO|nr:hypothetical protein FPHYL_11379 [Fusarium phyllophilum]